MWFNMEFHVNQLVHTRPLGRHIYHRFLQQEQSESSYQGRVGALTTSATLLASSCICVLLYCLPQTRRNRHLCLIISISRNTAISLFKQVKTTTGSWFQGPFSLILPLRDGWVPIYPWELYTACIVQLQLELEMPCSRSVL